MYLFLAQLKKLFTLILYPLRYYITVYNCSFKVKHMYLRPLNFKSALGRIIFRFRFRGAFPIPLRRHARTHEFLYQYT